jgi:hypothetical protein
VNGTFRQERVVVHNSYHQVVDRMESGRQRVDALLERVPPVPERDED